MVGSILEGIRNYLAGCPLLNEIAPKQRHIDWTSADGSDNYGIFFDGNSPVGEPYINGTQEWKYIVQINVRRFTDSDAKRLEASAFLERLQHWCDKQTALGNLPEVPEGCEALEIEALNAGLLEPSETGKKNIYMVQIALNYNLNGE